MLVLQSSSILLQMPTGVQADATTPQRAGFNVALILGEQSLSHEECIKLLGSLLLRTQMRIKQRLSAGSIDIDLQPMRDVESIYKKAIFDSKANEILRANPSPTPVAERKMRAIPARNVVDAIFGNNFLDAEQRKSWAESMRPHVSSEAKGFESAKSAADSALFEPLPNTTLSPHSILTNHSFINFCQDTQISLETASVALSRGWRRICEYASYFEDMRSNPAASGRHKPLGSPWTVGMACSIAVVQEMCGAGFDSRLLLSMIDYETQFRENPSGNNGKGIGQLIPITVLGIYNERDSINKILAKAFRPQLPDSIACYVHPDTGLFIPLARNGNRINSELRSAGREPEQIYSSYLSDIGHNMGLMTATLLLKMTESGMESKKPHDLTRAEIISLLKRYRGSRNAGVDAAYAQEVIKIYDKLKKVKY
ncbi:Uncharacterised protein [uncultured archaeon]|nr:Uncharacterised protein [uncultured archaeon]